MRRGRTEITRPFYHPSGDRASRREGREGAPKVPLFPRPEIKYGDFGAPHLPRIMESADF